MAQKNHGLDSQLWHACAGGMVELPQVGAKVIYFPQGHAEHAASPPEFPPSVTVSSSILCRVLSVRFLADPDTDEVYARISLQPQSQNVTDNLLLPPSPSTPKLTSFAKTLTQSDANNGGGFSVPRYCAETIFPRLDYSVDPPVQIVLAKDVHGEIWKFRHIYRGTPRRHLLTTGWSSFVNQKKLVAGDAIVFLRSSTGELCVGVRRSTRGTNMSCNDSPSWHLADSFDFLAGGDNGALDRAIRPANCIPNAPGNFARNRARVTAKSVLEAFTLAAAGQAFDVVYYPRASISEFCVKARTVQKALQQHWESGMRFKMAFETEDSSRISWFMGTIAKVQDADPVHWPNSPWKMLQVTWDEPDLLQGVTRANPWQIELVSPMQLPPFSLPKKKGRVSQPPDFHLDNHGVMGLTMATLSTSLLGNLDLWHGFTNSVSAGMQGARHDHLYGLSLQDVQPKFQPGFMDNFHQTQCWLPQVSTELNMSSFAQSKSPVITNNGLSAFLTIGNSSQNEPLNSSAINSSGRLGTKTRSFFLFGKAIDTTQSADAHPLFSGGSSSDGPAHDNAPDGNQLEVSDRMHIFLSETDPTSSLLCHGAKLESNSNAVGNLIWLKELSAKNKEKNRIIDVDASFIHREVFKECEVGKTVDLSLINSYGELYERLSSMLGVKESQILNKVLYTDAQGFSRHVGDEPYRDFYKRARGLRIVSDASSER